MGTVYIYQHRNTTSGAYLLYRRIHAARAAAEKLGYHRLSLPKPENILYAPVC